MAPGSPPGSPPPPRRRARRVGRVSLVAAGILLALQAVVFAAGAATGPRRQHPYGRIYSATSSRRDSPRSVNANPSHRFASRSSSASLFAAVGTVGFFAGSGVRRRRWPPHSPCSRRYSTLRSASASAARSIHSSHASARRGLKVSHQAHSRIHPTQKVSTHRKEQACARSDVLVSADWAEQKSQRPGHRFRRGRRGHQRLRRRPHPGAVGSTGRTTSRTRSVATSSTAEQISKLLSDGASPTTTPSSSTAATTTGSPRTRTGTSSCTATRTSS